MANLKAMPATKLSETSRQMPTTLARFTVLPLLVLACLYVTGCGRPADQPTPSDSNPVAADIFGKVMHFDGTHEADPYKVSGWSATESKFTWTEGKAAVLALPLPENSGSVRLRMFVSAYIHPPEVPSQAVEVYANGQKVADWQVTNKAADNWIDVPKELADKATVLTVQLRLPNAVAPAQFSPQADQRILALCCYEFELIKSH